MQTSVKKTIKEINDIKERLLVEIDDHLLPCLSETQAKIINLKEDDRMSTHELASIILEDYGLISKVLNTVNTFYFNRWGTYISTITKAVIILGFNTVRDIAISMAVLDLIPKKNKEVIVDIIARSFCAAYLTEKLLLEDKDEKREEIFLSALFTNLSRVFLALYNIEIYEKICNLEKSDNLDIRIAIKIMWRDIAEKVIEKWKLPKSLLNFIDEIKTIEAKDIGKKREIIKNIYKFIDCTIDLKYDEAKNIIKLLEELTNVNSNRILEHLQTSIKNTLICSNEFKPTLEKINLRKIVPEESILTEQVKTNTQPIEKVYSTSPLDREAIFWQLFSQLTSYKINETQSLGHLYLLAMEVIQKGLGFDNVLFCIISPDKQKIQVRYGIGVKVKLLKNILNINYPPENKLLKEAFQNKKEVILRWSELIKDINKYDLEDTSVCVSPIIISDKVIGAFVLSKNYITELDLQRVFSIRNLISLIASSK